MKVLEQQLLGLYRLNPWLPSSAMRPRRHPPTPAPLWSAPFHNPLVQRRLQNCEPRGTIFFLAPDVEDMIKECKFEGHPGPIGPVFHAQIHIKGSQARLLKAYGGWSKRSPLCEFYFILVVHIMFQSNHHQISCIIVSAQRYFNPPGTASRDCTLR